MSSRRSATMAHSSDEKADELTSRQIFFDRFLWIALALLAAASFAAIWIFLPHEREGQSKIEFILKISTFILAICAVALMPNRFRFRWLLTSVPFLVFLGFVIPKMTYLFLMGPSTEPKYYTYLWSVNYPGIILSICLAWRLAGGSSGHAIKIGLNGLILVFSGYLELMWFQVNPLNYYDMPSIPHVEVILGFFPTYTQLFIFALCHIPLLIIVNASPIDRWLTRARGPAQRAKVRA